MANSMTGYGRSEQTIDNYDITVEIKSVNHRYSDYSIKIPRFYSFMEDRIKNIAQTKISRGKIDIFITVNKIVDDTKEISLNKPLAEGYINALKQLASEYDLQDDISVSKIASFSDIFDVKYNKEDEEEAFMRVEKVMVSALDEFVAARKREGERLAKDMLMRNGLIKAELEKIKEIAPKTVIEYRKNLEDRIKELIGDASVDENRLLTETAIYADKLSITEEIVRLSSHLLEFDRIMGLKEPIGRKLDFLLQEMNRETNTIGSKANSLDIAKIVVNIKAELEKIREQVQNIE